MRAYIPLPSGLSATAWRRRYSAGEVPDESPYGLHRLSDFGVDVTFGETDFGRLAERAARSVRHRTSGVEMLEGLSEWRARTLCNTDVVFTYDERIGIPATLLRTRKHAPVMLGVGWLAGRSEASAMLAALAGRALPRAEAVWVQSSAMLPVLQKEWGVRPSRLHYVPCGIDADFYRVQPEPDVANVIASAGEDRHRDHRLLVEAVSKLRSRFPDIHLELATGRPVELPSGLGTLYRQRLDGKMRELYRRASLVALALKPVITGSGLTVALEAMSSGRPVVMTDNPGVSDYIQHGVTGLLVPPNDVDALASAIGELLADPQRRSEMGRAAAARVRERFTSGIVARRHAELLSSI
jgi:glycosyltransferase involved in cell wall biosynthesis